MRNAFPASLDGWEFDEPRFTMIVMFCSDRRGANDVALANNDSVAFSATFSGVLTSSFCSHSGGSLADFSVFSDLAFSPARLASFLISNPREFADRCFLFLGNRKGSKVDVHSHRRDNHWSPVAVVPGVQDVRRPKRVEEASPGVQVVVCLNDVFSTIVQLSIAQQEPVAGLNRTLFSRELCRYLLDQLVGSNHGHPIACMRCPRPRVCLPRIVL